MADIPVVILDSDSDRDVSLLPPTTVLAPSSPSSSDDSEDTSSGYTESSSETDDFDAAPMFISDSDEDPEDDSDEDPEETPIQPPTTPPKKRYRFDGTVIPGINGGKPFVDARGQLVRVTARKRVVPYPADPFIRKAPRHAPSTSGAGPSAPPAPLALPAPPAPPSPSIGELTREVEILRARIDQLEEQMAYVLEAIHPPTTP